MNAANVVVLVLQMVLVTVMVMLMPVVVAAKLAHQVVIMHVVQH